MLYCVDCGCCSELGNGWVAMRCDDPDPDVKGRSRDRSLCPPCAAGEFGYRPGVAETYVCAWEPIPDETPHTS